MFVFSPTLALVFLAGGTLLLVWEFLRPGRIIPGITGALLLAFGCHSLWARHVDWDAQWPLVATLFLPVILLLAYLLLVARKARRNKRTAIS